MRFQDMMRAPWFYIWKMAWSILAPYQESSETIDKETELTFISNTVYLDITQDSMVILYWYRYTHLLNLKQDVQENFSPYALLIYSTD